MGNDGRHIKTEHVGAKNGGGYWGPCGVAKQVSKKIRRERAKREILEPTLETALEDLPEQDPLAYGS